MTDPAPMRPRYRRAALLESDAASDPLLQFERWFADAVAADLPLPSAMTLATVTPAGRPAARLVLLKGLDGDGFVFYTNYESRKADELVHSPHAALVFHWSTLERQVRIEGGVERVSAQESDAYFASRPLGSRHSASASPQSAVVPNRTWLEDRVRDCAQRYPDEVPRPPFWGGYRVLPHMIEFWQGRDDRLHDRLCYRRQPGGGWEITRLAP